jgi:TolB-like protein
MASIEPAPSARREMQSPADAIVLAYEAPVRVGPLTIEPAMRRVRHDDGQEAFLQPRVMQALVALVRAEGEILSRDDMLARCWSGMVVGEDALNRVMARLRRLAEGPGAGVFRVETITKVGYRLIIEGAADTATPVAVPAALRTERRLAVLAFDNLSPDPEMSFFSDGVSEEILETVSRNTDLKVISRASSFSLRGANKATRHVAEELNVSHVLDGSVRRSGSRVRISAQLVECASETRIWSQRFERDLTDIFALQDEIATAVAEALKAEFSRAGPLPGKVDPAAYDLYLRARDFSITGPVAPRIEMLERCVALAPDFAAGWTLLASARAYQAIFERGDLELAPLAEESRAAVAIAEQLDPTMGRTRAVRASLEPWAAFQRREDLLSEALRLTPGDPDCLTDMSFLLGFVGRRREALSLAEEARSRDPLFPQAASRWLTALDERYDEQAAHYDAMRARWPGNIEFSVTASGFAAANGDWTRYDSLRRHADAQPFAENPATAIPMRRHFRFWDAIRGGDKAYLNSFANRLLSLVEATGTVPVESLWSAAIAGQAEAAFQAIDRAAFDGGFEFGGHVGNVNPGMLFVRLFSAPLMDDPRFLRLCAKLGLVHYWLETGRWPDCADRVSYDFRAEARKAAGEGLARHV